MVGAVGGEAIRLLEGPEMDLLAGLAFPVEADGLNLDDVVRLLLQLPEDAGAAGGVDFPDKPLRVSFLSLRKVIKMMLNAKQIPAAGSRCRLAPAAHNELRAIKNHTAQLISTGETGPQLSDHP